MLGSTMVAGFPCTPFSKSGKQLSSQVSLSITHNILESLLSDE